MGKRNNVLILVSGFKRSGKDFVSDLLRSRLEDSVIYSYASPMKDIIAKTLGISLEELDVYKNMSEPIFDSERTMLTDCRKVLQVFGTEAMKPWFGNAVWSDVFIRQDFKNKYIIIPDWRFNVEYEEAKKVYENVITLRVNDNNITTYDPHQSESELAHATFDYTIDNTSKDNYILDEIDKFVREML